MLTYTIVRPESHRPDLKLEIWYIWSPEHVLKISIEGNLDHRYFDLEPMWLEVLKTLKKEGK